MLELLRQPAALVSLATPYVRISILGVLPFFAFVVLRQSLQAMHAVRSLIGVVVVANVVNVALNWVLVYGNLGAPSDGRGGKRVGDVHQPLGHGGCCSARAAGPRCAGRWYHGDARRRGSRPCWRWCASAAPIGMQQTLEMGVFAAIGLLMGILGTREMAAHQIAINVASLTFMVPLGVGAAAAVRVGHAAGEGDAPAARERARAALVCGVGFMAFAAILLLAVPHAIAALYTTDLPVAVLAATLLPIAGMFQVFDGI